MTEEEQLAAVTQNGNAIYYITNPSEEMQLAAVQNNPNSIIYIKKVTHNVRVMAKLLS